MRIELGMKVLRFLCMTSKVISPKETQWLAMNSRLTSTGSLGKARSLTTISPAAKIKSMCPQISNHSKLRSKRKKGSSLCSYIAWLCSSSIKTLTMIAAHRVSHQNTGWITSNG